MATKVATGRVTKAKKEGGKKGAHTNPWLNYLKEYKLNNTPRNTAKGSGWLTALMKSAGAAYKALSEEEKQKYKVPFSEFKPSVNKGKAKDDGAKMETDEEEEHAPGQGQSAASSPAATQAKKGRKK